MQQGNRHRFDVLGERHQPGQRTTSALVEGSQFGTVRSQPAVDLESEAALDQWRGTVREWVIQGGTVLPADLDDVSEPAIRDERDSCAGSFEQRVGGDGGAMSQDGRRVAPDDGSDGFPNARSRIVGSREDLRDGSVVGDGVGERSAGVHSDAHVRNLPWCRD